MLSFKEVKLRPMLEEDLEMVLAWRNSDHVRHYSLNNYIIQLKDHLAWYERIRNDSTCDWSIAEFNSTPVGVVSITDINASDSTCTWGMYIGEDNKNIGLGVLVEIRAIDRMFDKFKIRKIWGQALMSNRIISTHKKLGFVEEGVMRRHILRNGQYEDIVLVALFADQWPNKRKEIFKAFNLSDG